MGSACLLLGAAAVFTIPSTPTKFQDNDGGLDWPGFLLGVTGMVLVNVGDQGPTGPRWAGRRRMSTFS
ncbi:aminotriazole resistance protein [Penicillium freii]|nr:aminotriazole resistance protein [Penicillium freii]